MPDAGDPKERGKAVAFRMRPETIRDLVRRLAVDSENVKWSTHAQERMAERGITDKTAMDVLRLGDPQGEIKAGANPGEWKVKMVRAIKGRREVGVVVLTVRSEHLLIKTVEWEDL